MCSCKVFTIEKDKNNKYCEKTSLFTQSTVLSRQNVSLQITYTEHYCLKPVRGVPLKVTQFILWWIRWLSVSVDYVTPGVVDVGKGHHWGTRGVLHPSFPWFTTVPLRPCTGCVPSTETDNRKVSLLMYWLVKDLCQGLMTVWPLSNGYHMSIVIL